jgi:hypothetical protein
MHFFGALDTPSTLPNRSSLNPRTDDRSQRVCRTLGSFAVYMHDFGLDQFDSRFRDDAACWNVTAASSSQPLLDSCSGTTRNRHYTWWCNKRPNNPCVFGCPDQVGHYLRSLMAPFPVHLPQITDSGTQSCVMVQPLFTCRLVALL